MIKPQSRRNFKKSRRLNKRFHMLFFRNLQTYIGYKALLEGIEVRYLTKKETKNTSKTCHRCGHVARVRRRVFKCQKCEWNMIGNLNACINIACKVMSSAGWGSCEPHGNPR